MTVPRALAVAGLFAVLLVGVAAALALAFGTSGKSSCLHRPGRSCSGQPLVTSTPSIAAATPDARAQQAIDLVVRVGALTASQATCIFGDHPSVLQEFAQDVDLGTTLVTPIDVKSITEALIRRNAVQLDRCLTVAGG
jgi:hypothetical protein